MKKTQVYSVPLILAIDTSSDACSVALNRNGQVREEFSIGQRIHTGSILPMIDRLLDNEGITAAELDAVAFGRGPGSFTGLRIASGVVQGIAMAANLPVVPVSTLKAMAYRMGGEESELLMPVIDARMDEVYWAIYQLVDGCLVERVGETVSPPVLVDFDGVGEVRAAGSGAVFLDQFRVSVATPTDLGLVAHAGDIAHLALKMFEAGEVVDAERAIPVYLRNEVAWKKVGEQA